MADSANTVTNILPDLKDTYSSKLKKAVEKGDSKKYFNTIKKFLKKKKPTT